MMGIGPRQWALALLVAGVAHGALALALLRPAAPKPVDPVPIAIDLTLAGGSADGTAAGGGALARTGAPDAGAALGAGDPAPPLTPVRDSGTATAARPPPEPVAARTAPAPAPKARSAPRGRPRTAAKPKPESKPESKALAGAPKRRQPPPRAAAPRAVQSPAPPRDPLTGGQPDARAAAVRPGPRNAASAFAGTGIGQGSGPGTATGAGRGPGKGSGAGAGGGSGSGAGAGSYYGSLAAWLNRHKRYPHQARRLQQEGTVRVTFTIDRQGRLISQRIVKGSGHAALDREVQSMLQRASPMPGIPAGLGRSRLTLTMPIVFALR